MLRRTDRAARSSRRSTAIIVTPRYLPLLGGMERECDLLAREFARRGWETLVVTEQLGQRLPQYAREDGIAVRRLPSSHERTVLVQLRVAWLLAIALLRHRRRAAFAVVRTFTLPALVVGLLKALRLIRFPTLVTAETGGVEDDVIALSRRPLFALSRAIVSRHDVLNGLCLANVEHLRETGFPESKIRQIPNGIDTGAWSTTSPPAAVRRFLFLGRIEPLKGVHELVEAFAEVHRRHPDTSLTFAGDGESVAALERRCGELGITAAVRFPGRVAYEELGRLFAEIDCLVLPSYSEGMPLSVLEAAAHHRVLIVTEVGDLPSLFGDRVPTCPPRDAAALADVMEQAVAAASPATDYQGVIDQVSIEHVAETMLEALLDGPTVRRARA